MKLLNLQRSNQFKKDLHLTARRGKDLTKLFPVVARLLNNFLLEAQHKDHQLTNNWFKFRECHIEPDWLLIYRIEGNILFLERTGSHSDLFG